MRKIYEAAVILIGTLGWWGFVYPELCLTEDVYEQECEEQDKRAEETPETGPDGEGESAAEKNGEGMSGNIRIKSRIVEYVYERK